jgi:hypothetical protein
MAFDLVNQSDAVNQIAPTPDAAALSQVVERNSQTRRRLPETSPLQNSQPKNFVNITHPNPVACHLCSLSRLKKSTPRALITRRR